MPLASVGDEQIYFVQSGERGTPIVFVHGAGGSHLILGNQVRALGAITRTIALDLPGHNKSGTRGRDTIEDYRDVVAAFLAALGCERAVIVGHSMGGAIALTFALSHPEHVAGIGLVGTGARLRVLPAILDGILHDFENTARKITEYSFAPRADTELMKNSEIQLRLCDPKVTHGDYSACNNFDVMDRLAEIRMPAVIICGKQDRLTPPKYSEFLASKNPLARVVLINGAGHNVMMEKPEEVNRALAEFARGIF